MALFDTDGPHRHGGGAPSDAHPGDPMQLFAAALARASEVEPFDATATSLATVGAGGMPSVRLVLLKGADPRGFVFYTNYESRKARELDATKVAALAIHWPKSEQQVRVEGSVQRVSGEESDAYFATRARGSQIGAWASDQSRPLESRSAIEARVREVEARFAESGVLRPPHWGGYLLEPLAIEFWYGRPSRLHDRFRYERGGAGGPWVCTRLNP